MSKHFSTQQHQQTAKQQIGQKANSIFYKWNYGNNFIYEFDINNFVKIKLWAMRSPRDHRSSRRRSPTLYQNKDRKRSASPSPPRPTAKTLKAIRITVSNVPGKPPTGTRVSSFD